MFFSSQDEAAQCLAPHAISQSTAVVQRSHVSESDEHINEVEDAIARGQIGHRGNTTVREQDVSGFEAESSSPVRTFIVGLKKDLVQLDGDISQVIECANTDEFMGAVSGLDRSLPILVVSTEPLTSQVTAEYKLVHHCCFLEGAKPASPPQSYDRSKSNVYSKDQLMTELHHKLGQYYQDCAIRASFKSKDQRAAKSFLEKSKRCYMLLEDATRKAVKRYAELLEKDIHSTN